MKRRETKLTIVLFFIMTAALLLMPGCTDKNPGGTGDDGPHGETEQLLTLSEEAWNTSASRILFQICCLLPTMLSSPMRTAKEINLVIFSSNTAITENKQDGFAPTPVKTAQKKP